MLEKNGINIENYNPNWLSSKNKRKNIGFGITASQNSKKWPLEKWIELARKINETSNQKIILFPGTSKEDLEKAKEIRKAIDMDKCKIIFQKTLPFVTKEIGKLTCFISNDTGLLHISSATATPTIGIYTATDPKVWSPYNKTKFLFFTNRFMKKCPAPKKHCGNCFHYYDSCPAIVKYGDSISPKQVFNTMKKLI